MWGKKMVAETLAGLTFLLCFTLWIVAGSGDTRVADAAMRNDLEADPKAP